MRVIIPGTFDPFTRAHKSLVQDAINHFGSDNVFVEILNNFDKTAMFTLEKRIEITRASLDCFISDDQIIGSELNISQVITKHLAEDSNIFILRGIRNCGDLEYERAYQEAVSLYGVNIFYSIASSDNSTVSSTLVRNIIQIGGPYEQYIATSTAIAIIKKYFYMS